jgi:hypothetical protein
VTPLVTNNFPLGKKFFTVEFCRGGDEDPLGTLAPGWLLLGSLL